jgi:hypothetical protein
MKKMKKLGVVLLITSLLSSAFSKMYGQCPDSIRQTKIDSTNVTVAPPFIVIQNLNYRRYEVFPNSQYSNDTFYFANNNGKKDTIVMNDSLFYSDTSVNYKSWKLTGLTENGTFYKCNVALPVELTDFFYLPQKRKLVWKTASETNNRGFYIQRKTKNSWENVKFVRGNGTTITPNKYTVKVDRYNKIQYFRIKQVDYDGSSNYSNILPVKFGPKQEKKNGFNL